jgi:hypothetical protein
MMALAMRNKSLVFFASFISALMAASCEAYCSGLGVIATPVL